MGVDRRFPVRGFESTQSAPYDSAAQWKSVLEMCNSELYLSFFDDRNDYCCKFLRCVILNCIHASYDCQC